MINIDKNLLLKILGKKDSVDLGDMIYNLRGICTNLRDMINLNLDITEHFSCDSKKNLLSIYDVIKNINDNLKDLSSSIGFTNSKKYLINFLNNLCCNLLELINSLSASNIADITHYNNILMDLILKY